jgi:hypothetical protein
MVYAKARQENLTAEEKKAARKLAAILKSGVTERKEQRGKVWKGADREHATGGKTCRWQEVRGLRVSKVELPDVKAIRLSTGGSESDTR